MSENMSFEQLHDLAKDLRDHAMKTGEIIFFKSRSHVGKSVFFGFDPGSSWFQEKQIWFGIDEPY